MEDIKSDYEPMHTHSSANLPFEIINRTKPKVSQSKSPKQRRPREKREVIREDLKDPWTEKEELEMLITHQKHQNKWSNIAQELKGRTNNSIKNRFYSIFRKIKNKIRKVDFDYTSRFEMIEASYIISLMKQYLVSQQQNSEPTGKRGKDFIYSLLRGLCAEEVKSYELNLQTILDKKTTLEELWVEMNDQNFDSRQAEELQNIQIPSASNLCKRISNPIPYDKSIYNLPPLHEINHSSYLTTEEKEFFKRQIFQNKEPASANSPQCSMVNCSLQSPNAYSVNLSQEKAHFKGLSDLISINCPSKTLNIGRDSAFQVLRGANCNSDL
jgi:hypothetical protein